MQAAKRKKKRRKTKGRMNSESRQLVAFFIYILKTNKGCLKAAFVNMLSVEIKRCSLR